MGSRSVAIEKILVKDLYEFACQTLRQASDGDVIPITRERAFAQSKNPYADENDVGLLVAYHKGKLVGYGALLPGKLRGRDGLTKVYYGSTSYVVPEYRKKLVAFAIMQEILSLPYDYAATGFNEHGKSPCEAFRLPTLGPLEYYTLNLTKLRNFSPVSLPVRVLRKGLRKATRAGSRMGDGAIRASDRLCLPMLKSLFYRLALRSQAKLLGRVRWEETREFGDQEARLIAGRRAGSAFYRGLECINWMLRNKWILEPAAAGGRCLRYEFSHVRELFRYIPLRVYSSAGGDYVGFLTLSISTHKEATSLKVLDFGCTDALELEQVAGITMRFAAAGRADRIIMPSELADSTRSRFPAKLFCCRQTRGYYCRPYHAQGPLARALSEIELNYCDGDCAFI